MALAVDPSDPLMVRLLDEIRTHTQTTAENTESLGGGGGAATETKITAVDDETAAPVDLQATTDGDLRVVPVGYDYDPVEPPRKKARFYADTEAGSGFGIAAVRDVAVEEKVAAIQNAVEGTLTIDGTVNVSNTFATETTAATIQAAVESVQAAVEGTLSVDGTVAVTNEFATEATALAIKDAVEGTVTIGGTVAVSNDFASEATALAIKDTLQGTVNVQVDGLANTLVGITNRITPPVSSQSIPLASGAVIYAGTNPIPTSDAGGRPGWFYTNTGAGNRVSNYYFYDGTTATGENRQQSTADYVYAVVSCDSIIPDGDVFPSIGVYTVPQGDGLDAQPWYRSRWVYTPPAGSFGRGERVFLYSAPQDADDPVNLYPELRHVRAIYNAGASNGPRAATERLQFFTLNTSSGLTAGSVQTLTEKLGFKFTSAAIFREFQLVVAAVTPDLASEVTLSSINASLRDIITGTDALGVQVVSANVRTDQLPVTLGEQPINSSLSVVPAAGSHIGVLGAHTGEQLATQATLEQIDTILQSITSGELGGIPVSANVRTGQLPSSLGAKDDASSLSIVPATGSTFEVDGTVSVQNNGNSSLHVSTLTNEHCNVQFTSAALGTKTVANSLSVVPGGGYGQQNASGSWSVVQASSAPVSAAYPWIVTNPSGQRISVETQSGLALQSQLPATLGEKTIEASLSITPATSAVFLVSSVKSIATFSDVQTQIISLSTSHGSTVAIYGELTESVTSATIHVQVRGSSSAPWVSTGDGITFSTSAQAQPFYIIVKDVIGSDLRVLVSNGVTHVGHMTIAFS